MRQHGSIMNTSTDDLSERISITYTADFRDEEGNIIAGSTATRCTCWAKVLPSGSRISDGYSEQVNEIDYRVIIRYRSDVTIQPDDIIVWRGKKLTMLAPPYDAESRHVWLVMECKELIENAGEA